jgi:putative inorganic carbon (HCO3(-)) transporter
VVAALFTYLLAGGATFNGVILPEFKELTLGWMALLALVWVVVRWRRRWVWHHTSLDGVVLLWALSFAVSLLANAEIWRRIAIGLWYVILYIVVWYVLHDLLGNSAVSREMLMDGFLIGGLIVLYFAYRQLASVVAAQPDVLVALTHLPRPVGTIGNPNSLGGFLVVLIPFVIARLFVVTRRPARFLLGIYVFVAAVLLILSASRGAWLGTAVGLIVWSLLFLGQRQRLSVRGLRTWWQTLAAQRRATTLFIGAGIAVGTLLAGTVFVRSFSEPGRGTIWRTGIYDAAARLFLEKPLFGHGLFTFGRGLARMQSMPPETAHSHAHDIPLQVAAEQGIVGLLVLVVTVVVLIRAIWHNWLTASGRNQIMMGGVIASVMAFGVHQLTDIPAMMPAVALSGLLALVLAVAPWSAMPMKAGWKERAYVWGVTLACFAVLVTGFWSTAIYKEYVSLLRDGIQSENFRSAAEGMQAVIDADSGLALYHLEQGELFGLAASRGDLDAAREGVSAYERFIELEPNYAVAWANVAALHWQLGEQERGIEAMQRAVDLAPMSWELAYNLGVYLEVAAETDRAREVYERVFFSLYPCTSPKPPEWEDTALRRDVLASGDIACMNETSSETVSFIVLQAISQIETSSREQAETLLNRGQQLAVSGQDHAWLHLGLARLAHEDGDDATAASELDMARVFSQRGFLDNDFIEGINIAHSQYLRTAIQRLFLPQVYFPTTDPLLLRMIDQTATLLSS